VPGGRDSLGGERRGDPVALRAPDDVCVIDVARLVRRQLAELPEAELFVPGGRLAPRGVPLFDA
jgi:hypothetical protein